MDYRMKLSGDKGHRTSALAKKWRWLVDWADFPISDYCCEVMKKQPAMRYEHKTGRKSFLGMMADESQLRKLVFVHKGCNQYIAKRPSSQPLLFWTKEDIWEYVRKYDVPYSEIYDKGVTRTGCMFCMFGIHREESPNRFERLRELHPKIYEFGMDYMGLRKVLRILDVPF
jgi:3'-phosphoadenosine 5'-phosphosulfate sulfotransferase (PAPS reductase)/FAD synthetase